MTGTVTRKLLLSSQNNRYWIDKGYNDTDLIVRANVQLQDSWTKGKEKWWAGGKIERRCKKLCDSWEAFLVKVPKLVFGHSRGLNFFIFLTHFKAAAAAAAADLFHELC